MGLNSRRTNIGNWWGRNIGKFIRAENVTEKMIRSNLQALDASGYRAWLWQSVETNEDCSCINKASGKASDVKCLTCYGSSRIGGMEKFGFV